MSKHAMNITRSLGAGAALCLAAAAGADTSPSPMTKPEDSWLSLEGEVASTQPDSFYLDYGEGRLLVEMDDWDWYDESRHLLPGDRVQVTGRIDDGLYEQRSIEASSVYVRGLNTYFYASDADEESLMTGYRHSPYDADWYDVAGTVTAVDGREFMLDTGIRRVQVDTSEMDYNPMDDKGYQRITVGDRVKVAGSMDDDLLESRELMADAIVSFTPDAGKRSS